MKIASADVLDRHLKPLCSRDNHVMKYEADHSRSNSGNLASYHCGSKAAVFDMTQPTDITCCLECLITQTQSMSPA